MIDHEDHPLNTFDISHIPVLFSGMDTFGRAQALFLATLTNIGDNDRDRLFCSKVNGAKKAKRNFVKRLKLMSQKRKRMIFK